MLNRQKTTTSTKPQFRSSSTSSMGTKEDSQKIKIENLNVDTR